MWQFAIDVGGTFCDVIARAPDGRVVSHKLLSSGRTQGVAGAGSGRSALIDPRRCGDPDGFWNGYRCVVLDAAGAVADEVTVERFDSGSGTLHFDSAVQVAVGAGTPYELHGDEAAPIVAIRYLMGLGSDQAIAACAVRFGTTRATNALLERRGARTALVVTEGFGDLLTIGDQSRPRLFDLDIRKPEPLIERSVEVRERIDARGRVVTPLDEADARSKLAALRREGVVSVGVCLLNAYRNPAHESALARMARDAGFEQVSTSAALSPTRGYLQRAENCVVDAYLAPVFRAYIARIAGALPDGRALRLMTGAGGLVGANRFCGASCVMSGPAGGLVGAAEVARRAGLGGVIAFDMGGTSTDVARFDGTFEYQYETRKAGVCIGTPVLAIETVAAGGGSICSFDGARFRVGPDSAGTHPGPACYGRGGPLTLTDVNLHLGRIDATHFPFPLDAGAVVDRLDRVARAVAASGHRVMTREEIAEGFLAIANERMAGAVKRITLERGIDAGRYALVCYGGAGGQHACAVARLLGISRVLVPRVAGVLSAYGIAAADVKRFVERPVHETCTAALLDALPSRLAEMEREAMSQLRAEGVGAGELSCTQTLDLRYEGAGSALTVPADDCLRRFEQAHRRRFGYVHAGRPIEITTARVEAVGGAGSVDPLHVEPIGGRGPTGPSSVDAVFGGRGIATPVHGGDALRAGDTLDGPVIVAEATHTVVVDPGWRAEVRAGGDLMLTDAAGGSVEKVSTRADPVGIELFNHHFATIAEQMGDVLRRTAMSTNVKERLDFSCAVFDRGGALIANAPHIPVHLGSLAECVRTVIDDTGDLHPDDCLVTNDPFRGGTHLPDVTVVTPVFVDDALAFFVASRAHHAEIGGVRPGSMPPDSTRLAEEGVLIRCFKLVEAGRERFDDLRALLTAPPHPSRAPEENIADLAAQVAANRSGVAALHALVDRYGRSVVAAYTRHVRSAAERKMRRAVRNLPDGVCQHRATLDDGTAIQVRITIDGAQAVVDFAGSGPVHPGNLNATRAIVTSAVLYCFRCLIDEDIPLNGGVLAPIRIVIPPGVLDPPSHTDPARCPAVAGGNVETSQRIVDAVFGALRVVSAGQGTMNNLTFGNDRFSYYETICGGAGAGATFDGADAVHTHMTNTRMTDPEVLEARYPVRLRRFAVRRGSGGRGRHRGGDGCVREMEFLDTLEVSLITQRRATQPYGLAGGGFGAPGRNILIRSVDGAAQRREPPAETLPAIARFRVRCGDRLLIETPGGGGWGEGG